jgi:hypothetical protein
MGLEEIMNIAFERIMELMLIMLTVVIWSTALN